MSELLEDQVSRLRRFATSDPLVGSNARDAIAMAVRVLSVIEFMDRPHTRTDRMTSARHGKILTLEVLSEDESVVKVGRKFRGETWLESFSEAGRALE